MHLPNNPVLAVVMVVMVVLLSTSFATAVFETLFGLWESRRAGLGQKEINGAVWGRDQQSQERLAAVRRKVQALGLRRVQIGLWFAAVLIGGVAVVVSLVLEECR
jgi:hypothetical protein